jgi:hypothetical protein
MQEILRNRLTVIPLKYESSKPIYHSKTTNYEYEESSLYFVECKSNLIETTDYNVTETIVTISFMSFTNIDISITLPGGGLTMKGPW